MKKNILLVVSLILNIFIAYGITTLLNIKNVVLFQSITAMNYTLTYEVIIWFVLTLLEYAIYKYITYRIRLYDEKMVNGLNKSLQKMKQRLNKTN